MSKSRKFRKIALQSEVLSIEEDEFEEADNGYGVEFNDDFTKEIMFLNDHGAGSPPAEEETETTPECSEDFKKTFKKVYHELAKLLHPDLNPHLQDDEEFRRMQEAYEQGDGSILIEMAMKRNIAVEFDTGGVETLEKQLALRQNTLERGKQSLRWIWCTSAKGDDLRKRIRRLMGINEGQYQTWLKNNS